MHGAGVIDSIVQRRVSGQVQEYYQLKLSVGNMVVMVPTDNTGEIGMRPVVSGAKAKQLMSEMEGIEVDMTSNWNRRYRENLVRLKSGDLLEVARVVKGLRRRESQRGAEDAPHRQTDPHLRAGAGPEPALRDGGEQHRHRAEQLTIDLSWEREGP